MEALSVIPLHKKEILNIFEDVLALNLADRKTFIFPSIYKRATMDTLESYKMY